MNDTVSETHEKIVGVAYLSGANEKRAGVAYQQPMRREWEWPVYQQPMRREWVWPIHLTGYFLHRVCSEGNDTVTASNAQTRAGLLYRQGPKVG
jgi:hypothetical protein